MANKAVSQGQSGFQLLAAQLTGELLEKRQTSAAATEKQRRSVFLGGAATISGVGLLGGVLEAIDTLENKELEWMISLGAYAAVIIAVSYYLLSRIVRAAAENDATTSAALENVIVRLVRSASAAGLPAAPPTDAPDIAHDPPSADNQPVGADPEQRPESDELDPVPRAQTV